MPLRFFAILGSVMMRRRNTGALWQVAGPGSSLGRLRLSARVRLKNQPLDFARVHTLFHIGQEYVEAAT